jgi:hypothetical protein
MTAYEEFKKRRQMQLQNGAKVLPTDLLDKSNYTTDEIASTRMQICEACPKLIKLTKQCKECGCFMSLKTKLNTAVCPLNKW